MPIPPYRVGDSAIHCSWSPGDHTMSFREVKVTSVAALDNGYRVTVALKLQSPGSRTPYRNGPPGRPEHESRGPGRPRKHKLVDAWLDQTVFDVNTRGEGLGLFPADTRLLEDVLVKGVMQMTIQTQIAAALVGPYSDRELLTHEEAADYLRMSVDSLYSINKNLTGPRYFHKGKRNLYPMWCLRQWVLEGLTPPGGRDDLPRPRRSKNDPDDDPGSAFALGV